MSIEARISQYGTVFGDWHIGPLLGTGSGGQSAVFELYRDNNGWREYSALKVINLIEEQGCPDAMPQYRKTEYSTAVREQRDRADQEVHLMEKLRGKTNIVDYLDHQFFNWSDSSGFGVDLLIRMEKLTDLRSELKRGRIFSEEEILKIGRDICQVLIICHKKNILHRDIKPENIFFNSDGDYKLGDFGVSRIIANTTSAVAGTGIGTAAYSAPEQYSGSYDKRIDIYSLGLVLYELCNGNRLPFARSSYITQNEIQIRLAGTELPPPGGSSGGDPYSTAPAVSPLSRIILKACSFDPAARYQSAEEMLMALNSLPNQNSSVPSADPYATSPAAADPYATMPAAIDNFPPPDYAAATVHDNTESTYSVNSAPTYSVSGAANSAPVHTPDIKRLLPVILGAAALLALIAFLFLPGSKKHEHVWTDATCTAPRICEECEETEGEALGHTWAAATCAAPQTCLACGMQTGGTLEHEWVEANCASPRMCHVCGAQQGTALGHDWVPATFLQPQTCNRCGQTEGTAIPTQNLDVQARVEEVSAVFMSVQQGIEAGLYTGESPKDGVKIYRDFNGEIRCILVSRGTNGIGGLSSTYRRSYYFSGGELVFAYYAGQQGQRFYFYEGYLMRWRHTLSSSNNSAIVDHDLEFSDEFLAWEALIFEEVAALTQQN